MLSWESEMCILLRELLLFNIIDAISFIKE